VTLLDLPKFRLVRLWVEPGARTSLQSHDHRTENWIVVGGSAMITVGNETRLVEEGDSAFAAAGAVHRLENPSDNELLEVIEVDVRVERDR
jgi:mannose-6-phosphate isomerase-like protein (cupin superfamily)